MKKPRVKFVTTGKPVQDQDARQNVVRDQPDVEEPAGPVDYEKLWRNLRYDSDTFWREFLKVQSELCDGCRARFNQAMQAAQAKAFGREP
jgi:hypothetical protein